jgi:hypothetical protein
MNRDVRHRRTKEKPPGGTAEGLSSRERLYTPASLKGALPPRLASRPLTR